MLGLLELIWKFAQKYLITVFAQVWKKTLIPRPTYDVPQCSNINSNCNVSMVSLEGIMSFAIKKKMT